MCAFPYVLGEGPASVKMSLLRRSQLPGSLPWHGHRLSGRRRGAFLSAGISSRKFTGLFPSEHGKDLLFYAFREL